MNRFHLLRHGEKEKVKGDPGLTLKGKEQAFRTGICLKDKDITKILSSPFSRAIQTAEEINKSLNVVSECSAIIMSLVYCKSIA